MQFVSFEGVCLPEELGGLGLKRAREINISLICKWFWWLRGDHLWVRVIKENIGWVVVVFSLKKISYLME